MLVPNLYVHTHFSLHYGNFKKKKKNPLEKIKKTPSKSAHIGPQAFFNKYGLAAQTSPELIFHIINMSQDSSVSLSVISIVQFQIVLNSMNSPV